MGAGKSPELTGGKWRPMATSDTDVDNEHANRPSLMEGDRDVGGYTVF